MTTSIDSTKSDKIKAFNTKQAELNAKSSTIPKPPPPPGMSKEEIIAQEAQRTKAIRDKEKAEEEAKKKQEEEQADILKRGQLQVQKATELVTNTTEVPRKWLESLPTPGGIATIIVILLFFLFAVIPIDSQGNTRLKLLWLSMRGNTHMAYTDTTQSTNSSKEVVPPPGQASGKSQEEPPPVDLSSYRDIDWSLLNLFGE